MQTERRDAVGPFLARERWIATLQERGDALPHVIGREPLGEQFSLVLDPLVEGHPTAGFQGLLSEFECDGALLGDSRRQRVHRLVKVGLIDDLLDEADRGRLPGVDRFAVEDHLHRGLLADEPRQPLDSPATGDDPKVDLRLAQLDPRMGDPDVTGLCEFKAATERVPVDPSDHGQVHIVDHFVHARTIARLALFDWRPLRKLGDVRARHERPRHTPRDKRTRMSSSAAGPRL